MRKSFIGREDHTLKARLMKEVQGVFNWALEGLDDLNETGKLLQPQSAQNYIETLDEGSSPHEQFLNTFCTIGEIGDEDSWRSEERRVGKGCVCKCRSRWSH